MAVKESQIQWSWGGKEPYRRSNGRLLLSPEERKRRDRERSRIYRASHKEQRREYNKRYCLNHKEEGRKADKRYRESHRAQCIINARRSQQRYKQAWLLYLNKRYPDPRCSICGKKLKFFSGSVAASVHFDHRNNGLPIKYSPTIWLRCNPCTPKNIKIWESCRFGVLCNRCNIILPTKNRSRWLQKVIHYVNEH